MAEPIVVHNGDSAAHVAFQLMDMILKNATHAYREKDLVLDLYAEWLEGRAVLAAPRDQAPAPEDRRSCNQRAGDIAAVPSRAHEAPWYDEWIVASRATANWIKCPFRPMTRNSRAPIADSPTAPSGVVGCNVQVAVDTEHHLIVAHEVTNSDSDRSHANSAARTTLQSLLCRQYPDWDAAENTVEAGLLA